MHIRSKSTFLGALFFFVSASLSAQWGIVRETERSMSFGNRSCFRVEFSNIEPNVVLDTWKEFVRKTFDAKVKKDRKGDEYIASEARADYITLERFTIYAQVEKNGATTALNVWFDLGNYFLSSRENPESARETADVLRQFYYDTRRNAIAEELKAAENQLKTMESQLKKLERDNEALYKSIEDYKARIKKAEEDILKNTQSQEAQIVNMGAQQRRVEEIKGRMRNVENERQ
jgi:hypothetical protein